MKKGTFLDPTRIDGLGPRYVRHPGPYAIGEADLCRIFPSIDVVRSGAATDHYVKGLPYLEPVSLRFLTRFAKYLEPETVVEVGTSWGHTTLELARHAPETARIITIDVPKERFGRNLPGYGTDTKFFCEADEIGREFAGTPESSRIVQILEDSTSQECEDILDSTLNGRGIDFAFIDAAHDYESVRSNFEGLIYPRLTQNGVVVFDDYLMGLTHVGVMHFLTRKAHDDGFVFYWFAPQDEVTRCVFFMNVPESARDWRR